MPSDRIVVRELKPGLAADYFEFFDDIYDNDPWLNSKDNPWWGGCYCSFWDDLREEDEINSSKDKRSANRTARLKRHVEHCYQCSASFLRALFDAEGTIARNRISIYNRNLSLLLYIGQLLYKFGIETRNP